MTTRPEVRGAASQAGPIIRHSRPRSGIPVSAGWFAAAALVVGVCTLAAAPAEPPAHGLTEVGHPQVELRGGFWGPRLKTHQDVTLPHALDELEKDGHVTNFDKAAGVFDGPLKGHHAFDSDLHKTLEGALDSLQHFADPPLRQRVDGILKRVLAAQQKDGFLISWFIVNGLEKKWDDLRLEHQMYNAGHFFEMAVAHQQLTGEPAVIDSAKRFADEIGSVFGPGKRYDVDGHEEVELALVKLYRATGERRYLELAKFFLDERGYVHGAEHRLFDPSSVVLPVKPEGKITPEQQREFWHARLRIRNGRMQDHKPLAEQFEAVGHAVRAGYVYSAMTDCARFMEVSGFERALDHLWDDVTGRKMYLTGAIGTGQYDDEGFGDPYLLPNASAYCESCAAIAHVLWQYRMALLKGQAKYADVMELALYNAVLSGISIAGDRFFYQNPLASETGGARSRWIGLSCCPTNLARIIPQVGGLVYARGSNKIYVNLYAAGEATMKLDDGGQLKLGQQTDYPWDGHVRLTVTPERAAEFELCLRIPGWALGRPVPGDLYRCAAAGVPPVVLKLNDKPLDAAPGADGYVHLQRQWHAGDVVELELPMPVQRVHADERVNDDHGRVALMRGPLVYCIEAADHTGVNLARLVLPKESELRARHRPELLGGITVIEGKALTEQGEVVPITAIPYYAWANRQQGAMEVWIRQGE